MKKLEHILHSRTELNLEAIALMGQMQASQPGCSCSDLWGFQPLLGCDRVDGASCRQVDEAVWLLALLCDRCSGCARQWPHHVLGQMQATWGLLSHRS